MQTFMVSSIAVRTDGPTPEVPADRLEILHPALLVSCIDCGAPVGQFCPGGAIHVGRERVAYDAGYL